MASDENHADGLFSHDIFKQYVMPKLLEIFRVRDAEVRKLLLNYFAHYFECFSKEQLQSEVLPEVRLAKTRLIMGFICVNFSCWWE